MCYGKSFDYNQYFQICQEASKLFLSYVLGLSEKYIPHMKAKILAMI